MELTIRCTYPACTCECFLPCESQARVCQTCKHGWVAHVLDKLVGGYSFSGAFGLPQLFLNMVEPVSISAVFDVASLVLYGSQAVPIRLKILLDRLLAALATTVASSSAASLGNAADIRKAAGASASSSTAEAAIATLRVLNDLGWSYDDYTRGYVLQDLSGKALEKWTIMNRDEEYIALQQFSRFAETRTLAQEMLLQDARATEELCPRQKKTESDIRKFIERTNLAVAQSYGLALERGGGFAAAACPVPDGFNSGPEHSLSASRSTTRLATAAMSSNVASCGMPAAAQSRRSSAGGTAREHVPEHSVRRQDVSGQTLLPRLNLASDRADGALTPGTGSFSAAFAPGPLALVDCLSAQSMSASSPASNRSSTTSETRLDAGEDAREKEWDEQRGGGAVDGNALDEAKDGRAVSSSRSKSNGASVHAREPAWLISRRGSARPRRGEYSVPSVIPAGNGLDRKRVLCTECNKTFCDKGALKIHHSAVHLREMHRCTIAGCTMTFSSRRSRNRHSNNPNPKLHTAGATQSKDDESDDASGSDDLSGHAEDGMLMDDGEMSQSSMARVKTEDCATDEYDSAARSACKGSPAADLSASGHPDGPARPAFGKWESGPPLHGSSKRKRLVPTRHIATARSSDVLGPDDDDDDDDETGDQRDCSSLDLGDYKASMETGASSDATVCRTRELVPNGKDIVPAATAPYNGGVQLAYCFSPPVEMASQQPAFPHPGLHGAGSSDNSTSESCATVASQAVPVPSPSGVDSAMAGLKNSRQCPKCLKVFQNHFSAKIHFESVHLRLMHQCTIEGCTASFPSKRSRDRHSSNANLHRRQSDAARTPNLTVPLSGIHGNKSVEDGVSESSDGEYSTSGTAERKAAVGLAAHLSPRQAAAAGDGPKITSGC